MSVPESVRARLLDAWLDPAALFVAGPGRRTHAFWLDAGPDAVDGWSWLGEGEPASDPPRETVCATAPGETRPWGSFSGGWVGWFSYDAAAATVGAPAAASEPAASGLGVQRFIAVDHATRRQWAVAPSGQLDAYCAEVAGWCAAAADAPVPVAAAVSAVGRRARVATARHTPAEYAALIERCRDAIRDGDAYQLCLTTRFTVTGDVDPLDSYLSLRAATPAHHGGIIQVGDRALLSASPEQFLQVDAGVVRTRPIKGTRPRAADPVVDAALAAELLDSAKERAENVMIVDLMRNDLQRVCLPGTVAAERLLEVESYPAVHQLVSTVAGRLRSGIPIGDVLDATFPAGSMTGAPKLSAMTILHELEAAPRGVFAGCFGWIGHDGRADLAMVIRSIVTGPGEAYVGAGGGITWGSDAASEVAEVGIKARGPLAALGATLPPGW